MKKTKQLTFQPIQVDDDELMSAIVDDPSRQDDRWNLHEAVDPEAIERFWSDAVKDLGDELT